MRINHNIASLNTYRQLTTNTANNSKSLEKLSSGLRINRAGDDAAGLAISEKMRGQIRGLEQASRNSQDAISLIQTAEGALNETHSILQRMRELAVQSSTDTNTADDRSKIQAEVDQLAKEITRISNTTEFNTQNLLAGGMNDTFHIGANAGQNINLTISAMDAQSLGVAGSTSISANFVGGTSGITGVSNEGRGFVSAAGYNIDVSKVAAGGTAAVGVGTVTGTATVGNSTLSAATAYTGTTDKAYFVKVSAKSGNDISQIQYSNDNVNWTTVNTTAGVAANLGDGVTVTYAAGTVAGDYAVGDTVSFTRTASYANLQLQDSGNVNIGAATKVYNGATSATVGDATTGKTITASFASLATLTNAQSATFDIISAASTAALTSNGQVTTAADTKAGLDVSTQTTANTAITSIDNAIKSVSTERSKLGAYQNRLEHTIANLGTSSENLTASESRVRDVDMAKEMMEFTKNNILSQAAQAMLAQANQQPQGVLQLLR